MWRKLGLTISYLIAICYVVSIVLPSIYCLRTGCKGPAELDAFMPAFALTPVGALATAFALHNSIQHIRKRELAWVYWPLAIVFGMVLLGIVALVAVVVYYTAFRR